MSVWLPQKKKGIISCQVFIVFKCASWKCEWIIIWLFHTVLNNTMYLMLRCCRSDICERRWCSVWIGFLFLAAVPASFACDDMVYDRASRRAAPDDSVWDDAVILNRDWWALWMGTVVIALHGASDWQCDMQGQADDGSIISSHHLPSPASALHTL